MGRKLSDIDMNDAIEAFTHDLDRDSKTTKNPYEVLGDITLMLKQYKKKLVGEGNEGAFVPFVI